MKQKQLSFSVAIAAAKEAIKEAQLLGVKYPIEKGIEVMELNGYSFDRSGIKSAVYSHPLSGREYRLA